jgi:prepilin-type N-terminal cleavage/methylation domain-containing protein
MYLIFKVNTFILRGVATEGIKIVTQFVRFYKMSSFYPQNLAFCKLLFSDTGGIALKMKCFKGFTFERFKVNLREMTTMSKRHNERGFTLVELAIVLVIIGLIVGGVLVGQDLIKAAQVRALVSQLQQYDAAINTFRSKYDGLPGDFTRAVAFGLGTAGGVGDNGNGNGLLDNGSTTPAPVTAFADEPQAFWYHLSRANLVGGSYSGTGAVLGTDFPENKLKKGGIVAFSKNGSALNYYGVGVGSDGFTYGAGLTPSEAFGVDAKLDDGNPNSGIVRATAHTTGTIVNPLTGTSGAVGGDFCVATGTPVEYNVSKEANFCPLEVRISG